MDKEKLLTIGRPQKACANCGATIDAIERHPSALRASDDTRGLARLDYCPDCWQVIKNEAFDSFWMTRRETGPRRAPRLSRRERATASLALFETLWEKREQEDVEAHLFLLAHLLMKWGGLKWRENIVDAAGRQYVVFEDPRSGDTIPVAHVEMEDARILEVKLRIEEFLAQYASEDQEVSL